MAFTQSTRSASFEISHFDRVMKSSVFTLGDKRIQLFQLTLSDQSRKLEDKTARLCGIFFWINSWKPAMPRPYSEDLWWRAIWMKEIPGYQADEVAAVSRMASLGFRPYCRTRKHQWALFRSCVNWLVNLSSDETITWKYKITLLVLLFSITLKCIWHQNFFPAYLKGLSRYRRMAFFFLKYLFSF